MGRIIAIGGGDLNSTHKINQYIVSLTNKERPKVLFIGTASHDSIDYYFAFREEFKNFGCDVVNLRLSSKQYSSDEVDDLLDSADIIYVGGGDTAFMIEVWKKYGLDNKLKNIYLEDKAVLSGISAGAMCWFKCGHSDSEVFWKDGNVGYGWVDGLLNIQPYILCPHYNERALSFDKMIIEKKFDSIALDDCTAFVEVGGRFSFISSNEISKAYIVKVSDNKLIKEEQIMERLF